MKTEKVQTNLKVNDNVVIINGSDKGRRGKILYIDRKRGRVVVEGVNKRNKFVKATSQENPKGGVVNREFPISISNIMIFCEKCKKGVRMSFEIKDDNKNRVCSKCGKNIV